jgi:tetratricopeptide (TPR) repeat protein
MMPSPEQRRAVLARRAKLLLALFRGKEAAPDLEELLEVRRRDGDKAAEVDTLLDLGSAYWTVALDDPATLQKSRDALENAYTLARELGDKAKMARALLPTMWFTSFWPDYADTLRKNIEEAYALSLDVGDEDLLLDARRARFSLWRGEDAEAEGAAIRVELEKKGSLVRLNDILFSLMWLYYRQAKFALCVECCDEGTAVARRIGAKPVQYASIKGLALLDLGRFDAAWNSFQQEVADEDTPFGRAQRDLGIAAYYAEVLAFERADAAARDVIEQARKVGRPWIRAWAQTILASAALSLRGVEGDTADAIREELRRSGARLSPEVLGEALLAAGAAGEALDQAEDALAAIAATQRTREATIAFGRRAWPALLDIKARALIALERADEALPLVDEAIAFARAQDYRRVLWRLLATLGAAREALGQTEAAARAYDEAAASVAALAETIPDDRLRRGFMANPAVAAVLEAGSQSAGRRR